MTKNNLRIKLFLFMPDDGCSIMQCLKHSTLHKHKEKGPHKIEQVELLTHKVAN